MAGFFANQKYGLIKGYIAAVIARGAFHALGGYLYWMDYMPDNFPKSLTAIYPVAYNYAYIGVEAVITVVILSLPAMKRAMEQLRGAARA